MAVKKRKKILQSRRESPGIVYSDACFFFVCFSNKPNYFCPFLFPNQLYRQCARRIDTTPRLHPSAAGKQGAIGGAASPTASPGAAAPGAGGVQASAACRAAEAHRATEGTEEAAGGGRKLLYLCGGNTEVTSALADIFLSSAATTTRAGNEEAARARAASPRAGREATH